MGVAREGGRERGGGGVSAPICAVMRRHSSGCCNQLQSHGYFACTMSLLALIEDRVASLAALPTGNIGLA